LLVGVDVGSSAVKTIQLQRSAGGYALAGFALEPLPAQSVVAGAIADVPAVAGKIAACFKSQRLRSKDAATAVSGHSVIVKRISMPLMSAIELYDRIQTEAGQHIPFDIAEVNVSYHLIETSDHMDVLLVAAKKDKIQNHLRAFTQAGKTARVLDVEAFALQNCFEANYLPSGGDLVVLLNIGASITNIVIENNGAPLFTRDVALGGNQYTEALCQELGLSHEDADTVKMGGTRAGLSELQRDAVLRSVSETIALEIQKTFEYFRATGGGENITQFFVAGGSAHVPGLLALLSEEFGVAVVEMNPFQSIALTPGRYDEAQLHALAPRLAVAVGLAMRSTADAL
jgi:type IV pilus assembly protein PilM